MCSQEYNMWCKVFRLRATVLNAVCSSVQKRPVSGSGGLSMELKNSLTSGYYGTRPMPLNRK